MLAYELFLNNKGSQSNNPKSEIPLKKIFYKKGKITIDKTSLEEFGSQVTKDFGVLQKGLAMTLNTIKMDKLNLPDFRTGPAAQNPYVEVYGKVKTNSKSETKIELSIGKNPSVVHTLDMQTGGIVKTGEGKIVLKLDKKNYHLKNKSLFLEYVNSQIVNKKSELNLEPYNKVIEKFLNFVKKQKIEFKKQKTIPFRIFILPDKSDIKFQDELKEDNSKSKTFVDYFGNSDTSYASKPTKTTKFISFDDKAFTINCKTKTDFYKNLGIGKSSLEKIFTDTSQTFSIARLEWTFTDISDPDFKFKDTKKGILTQLYENYTQLLDGGKSSKAQLKIICIRKNQAKQELFVDENLTMVKMNKMFSNIKDVPALCFEKVLIDNSGKNPVWDTYLHVIKKFLAGNKISKNYLLSFFTKILNKNKHDWIKLKNKSEQNEFFERTDFCMKTLSSVNTLNSYMDSNEEVAQSIGQIARAYVDFKEKNGERDNSLSDMLTYSKYDRDKLSFVYSRICRGVQLSKISNEIKKEVTEKITSLTPDAEINDEVSSKDYSYFFYKGYYSKLEVTA